MTDWPLWWASAATVFIFIVLLGLAWSQRREQILQDAADDHSWRDLRIWATVLILIQLMIYYLFS